MAIVRPARAQWCTPAFRQCRKVPPGRCRHGPRRTPVAGACRLHRAAAGPVCGGAPRLSAVHLRRGPGHPDPADRRCAGAATAARCTGGRVVPRRLRPGQEPRHVDPAAVRPVGAAVPLRDSAGHLHHHRLGAPQPGRSRLRHEEGAGHRQEVGSDERRLRRRPAHPGAPGMHARPPRRVRARRW